LYFRDWLLQPRRRAEQAFVSVIADAYLAGVSTRRVEKLERQLGVERMSTSQLSRRAQSLDGIVEDFPGPLDGAPYACVTLDAPVVKCREGGRINVCVVHAVGVNRDGFTRSQRRCSTRPGCASELTMHAVLRGDDIEAKRLARPRATRPRMNASQ